jgi:hypothetical protein
MAGAFTAWFGLSTRQGTCLPTPESCIPGTAGSPPVTAMLALPSGCASQFLQVKSFVTHRILNPSAIILFQQAEESGQRRFHAFLRHITADRTLRKTVRHDV